MVIPETAAAIVRQRRTRKPRGEVRNRARAMDVERREKNELIRARERYINDVSKDSRARPEILPEFLDDRHLPVVHEDAAADFRVSRRHVAVVPAAWALVPHHLQSLLERSPHAADRRQRPPRNRVLGVRDAAAVS